MKIEKINDNKIRCTLTSADLAERNLNLKPNQLTSHDFEIVYSLKTAGGISGPEITAPA